MKKLSAVLAVLLLVSTAKAEFKLIPLFDADIRMAYSSVLESSGGYAGSGWIFFMPAMKLSETDYILPVFNINVSLSERVIEEETLFLKRMNNLGSVAYKHKFSKELEGKVSFDTKYNFNMETKDEPFGKGLYDLYDIGVSGSVSYNFFFNDKPLPLMFGAKYYQRKYPNYTSLGAASVTITDGKEFKPKDFNAVAFTVDYKTVIAPVFAELTYNLVCKNYLDAYTRTSNGEISDTIRLDTAHYVTLSAQMPVSQGTMAGLDIDYSLYASNGSIYDSTNLVFTGEYYAFGSLAFKPYYSFNLIGDLNAALFYQILFRNYKLRKARDSSGAYTSDNQSDLENAIGISLKYPIDKNFNLVAGLSYMAADSNMKYQDYVKYNFKIFGASAGVSMSF
ncbi:MAG: hypothetical protein A2452_07115 [Candidatus Firestonebacteria bacterium RIFOXYC2_FULL_39_67]|nr:MAG: hypothetical protein A2536_04775 [Candidatus Firestonebacteria bacterium RIFOXYD2_FULL_39_29]OGF51947.1 MAG: hypothetical protein A2497_06930 [Candidatus Firestonebacteria bacterium RifOxyC12_full_39_7]OGF54828.1 MAG: hypothetical protein A2452_07115 [Candidatus Firestonebacteria bacterium RIFOXYC2_FULL_39_67]